MYISHDVAIWDIINVTRFFIKIEKKHTVKMFVCFWRGLNFCRRKTCLRAKNTKNWHKLSIICLTDNWQGIYYGWSPRNIMKFCTHNFKRCLQEFMMYGLWFGTFDAQRNILLSLWFFNVMIETKWARNESLLVEFEVYK